MMELISTKMEIYQNDLLQIYFLLIQKKRRYTLQNNDISSQELLDELLLKY